ncbi:MotA/TolQ/ExbB proton channel family protein [Phormidium sp. FACHB-1136]|uniref:MotA/TolQ/ExbB proton channel family protein n=1 Tax=Phormidium sp. FACHB-1136 TaxID=2692848 RepID=UPI001683BD59|nr:MotA/TolQ/ExbB proton channel family protein [Phormidium sp. FACHB-1136]MBD2425622.1 MotA/TolQ/ExbB proton channel family protein [Phormidium sp. FACHB-1136]
MANLVAAGGIVMVPLLLFSGLTLALVVERAQFWWQLHRQQRAWLTAVLGAYADHPQRAVALLKQRPHSPMARIFLAALSLEDATPEEFSLALDSAAQAEIPQLKRFQTWFETVVGIAPLLGLLGTVLGLMEALSSLRMGEGGNEAGVTLGVGEALTSTAVGIVVAMVALLFANLFQGLYRRQRALIQETGGKLEILQRRYYRQTLNRESERYR